MIRYQETEDRYHHRILLEHVPNEKFRLRKCGAAPDVFRNRCSWKVLLTSWYLILISPSFCNTIALVLVQKLVGMTNSV